jgi:hypothetical protein
MLTCAVTDMYTFKSAQRTRSNARLRRVAMRTFIGAICTLTSSVMYVTLCPLEQVFGSVTNKRSVATSRC